MALIVFDDERSSSYEYFILGYLVKTTIALVPRPIYNYIKAAQSGTHSLSGAIRDIKHQRNL